MKQTCVKCNAIKPLKAFVKASRNKNGYTRRCKECHKALCQMYVTNNPEKRKESLQKYYLTHKEECNSRSISWAKRHPKRTREARRQYRKSLSPEQRSQLRQYALEQMRIMRQRHPEKYKARNKVNNAVARGVLPRISTLKCRYCSRPAQEYHHHMGYEPENWLNVEPVCTRCHGLLEYPITYINDFTDILPPTTE